MPDRRPELLDAAITIVADHGLKVLTHRAVDRAAGAPLGTTSNYWRTRTALVTAILDRLEERDLATWATGHDAAPPSSPAELAALLATAVAALAGPHRTLSRARLILSLDQPHAVAAAHARFVGIAESLLRVVGADDATARARRLADHCDGSLLHALTVRQDEALDVGELSAALEALITAPA
ncbi:TetR/AcrR family transcriptional regulator [Antribacter gilvus]|uniref:TetR/AcrR family transcriptional regulator n=1 Tax=Antribacter gilvus TaxID=2304675 RepID=UPI000F770105|nr:TetR/AcrR family transcriptional regulator [Antribacter gilvus]